MDLFSRHTGSEDDAFDGQTGRDESAETGVRSLGDEFVQHRSAENEPCFRRDLSADRFQPLERLLLPKIVRGTCESPGDRAVNGFQHLPQRNLLQTARQREPTIPPALAVQDTSPDELLENLQKNFRWEAELLRQLLPCEGLAVLRTEMEDRQYSVRSTDTDAKQRNRPLTRRGWLPGIALPGISSRIVGSASKSTILAGPECIF